MTTRMTNLRDLGGLPVAGGRTTRHGVLFRSDAPRVGDLPPTHLPTWPPGRVVDLRAPAETAAAPYDWGPGVDLRPLDLMAAASPDWAPPGKEPDCLAGHRMLLNFAAHYLRDRLGKPGSGLV
ncbi:tyrosine-protein phosphatase [Streptomyces brasiliensis]|uniref:Uncharacterized protein n=1 Tax=Streptomyces brasiliensis TaxID=1954 RepID=A0A917L426_9ACTN|nr:tyrosine-protein phosphatase [Streptomyces brasiliensis]GGJ41081.1 hypothetical protein GCM10010121_060180 [Streptomyces brasiliensis]